MLIIYDYINATMKAVLLLPMLSLWTLRVCQLFPKNQIQSEHLFTKMFTLKGL